MNKIALITGASRGIGSPNEYIDYAASKGAIDSVTIGLRPTLHADSPMFPAEPPSLMQTAMTRRAGTAIGVDQAISREQASRSMTINGAWQLGMEKKLGSLDAGKLADMVILNRNPLTTPPEMWRTLKVESSILAGVPGEH